MSRSVEFKCERCCETFFAPWPQCGFAQRHLCRSFPPGDLAIARPVLPMDPGRELDALVAEKVMRWERLVKGGHTWGWMMPPSAENPDGYSFGREYIEKFLPYYSTEIVAAWEVWTEMKKRSTTSNGLARSTIEPWAAFSEALANETESGSHGDSFAENIWWISPYSICLAALKAIKA